MKNVWTMVALGVSTMNGACVIDAGAEDDFVAAAEQNAVIIPQKCDNCGGGTNGASINGIKLNGSTQNGDDLLSQTSVRADSATGLTLTGEVLVDLTLRGSEIRSTRQSDGAVLRGNDLIGATFSTTTFDGEPITLRILAHSPSAPGTALDITHRYNLQFSTASVTASACGIDDNGQLVPAIPLQGRWSFEQDVPGGGAKTEDPDLITFACDDFALSKCVDAGYKPWTSASNVALSDHHQACVRMLRADYCGNGHSYTQDGMLVNLYDSIGIQSDTEAFLFEAEWTADGARCLSTPRLSTIVMPDCALFEFPASECGLPVHWSHTLIASEAP